MKKVAFLAAAFLTAAVIFAFVHRPTDLPPFDAAVYKQKSMVRCTPDWNSLSGLLDQTEIMPMPGAGKYQWKIATTSDSAQFYFNQGINMYYGFHIIEAMASFKKAARFDGESPMVWWAQALAYGPNINDMGYSASPEALEVTQKAVSLLAKATPVEKTLIEAMQVRYSNDSLQSRAVLNQAYADAMKQAYENLGTVPDIITLYADALMLQHPWDLWNKDGTPKPWTPQIRTVLEKALSVAPLHPGANHYYIHVMEPSPFASKALPSADRLGLLTPGLSHMVHMPSHIYLRTGQFNKGAQINEEAVNQFNKYKELFPAVSDGAFIYQLHNQHMQVNCAMLAGRYAYAAQATRALRQAIDTGYLSLPAPLGSGVQYAYMIPVLMNVRFEKWDSLLLMAKPSAHHVYATILYHFGRGMALTAKKEATAAAQEARQMKQLMVHEDLKIPMKPFSAAIEGATCAYDILTGFMALSQNDFQQAITHFTHAVQTEEAMVYSEPRDWLLNPAPYLGAAYLKAGQYARAEQAFKKDLRINDQNVWALHGLVQALQKQRKTTQALQVKKDLAKAAEKSDVRFATLLF
jgi:tetratricopeptide (TPR) repeat protein